MAPKDMLAKTPRASSWALKRCSWKRQRSSPRRLWAKLPKRALRKILEKLPLSDYIRFAAVCVRWRSVQKRQRYAHCPSPPPMLSLPWFFFWDSSRRVVPHLSPFESCDHDRLTSYRLENPIRFWRGREHLVRHHPRRGSLLNGFATLGPWSNCGGWLVLSDCHRQVHLLNPVSGRTIMLPQFDLSYFGYMAFLVPPPHYSVFLVRSIDNRLLMIREGGTQWIELDFPVEPYLKSICIGNDLYSIVGDWDIAVLWSAKSGPFMDLLTMDKSQLPSVPEIECFYPRLVESDGQLLLVLQNPDFEKSQVFEADLNHMRWVRKISIGDRIIILDRYNALSLSVSGLGGGFKRNHIYRHPFSGLYGDDPILWKVLDLGTGKLEHHPLLGRRTKFCHRMFVPSIC